tara:strand:- start:48368 stop:49336 length:969 start_codon:yes stop_codon:yes gene_type:complete
MFKRNVQSALILLAGSLLHLSPTPTYAQLGPSMPDPELIANADNYQPPLLTEYAEKLAQQPDISGLWSSILPPDTGFTFDPANSEFPEDLLPGESTFGPLPGTKVLSIPLNDEYQALYDQYIEELKVGLVRDDFATCVPYGIPRAIGNTPVPFDIIQSPEVIFWYNDYGMTSRRIFLDGREHPTERTPTGGIGPTYSGHSIGQWEGNTLVVETVDMLGDNFDETGTPYSPELHMVERIRLIDTNYLEIEFTFTDPIAFTEPWVVTRYYARTAGLFAPMPEDRTIPRAYINLQDRPCIPNAVMENGFQRTLLPMEIEAMQNNR